MKNPMPRTDDVLPEKVPGTSRYRLVALALIAVVAIYLATTTAAVQVLRKANPPLALQIDPDSADALTTEVQRLISERGLEKPGTRKRIQTLAMRSVQSELVNPRSLAALGAVYEANGNRDRAYPFFSVASEMTQRELFAQLWLATYEAQSGKFEDALRHYDTMLRVSPRTSELLYPVLAKAMVNPASWPAYRKYFKAPPQWFTSFVRFVIRDKDAVVPAVTMMSTGSRLPDEKLYNALEGEALGGLFQRGKFDQATRFMAAVGGAGGKVGRSASFSRDNRDTRFGPFAWQPSSDASIGGGFESQSAGSPPVFRASATAVSSGVVLAKSLVLAPGSYALSVPYMLVEGDSTSQVRWRGLCSDGRTLFDSRLPNIRSNRTAQIAFTVDGQCGGQTVQMIVSGGDTYPGVEVIILEPSLRPVQTPS